MSNSSQTAILLFSRAASDEAVAKPLLSGSFQARRQVAKALIRHTQRTAQQSGLPVFTTHKRPQHGKDFGERLSNALEDVFAQGFDRVIAIGNDSPDLTTAKLVAAHSALCEKDLALGPAADGGLYLIGISQSAYDRAAFLALPWETEQLQAAYQALAHSQERSIHWLPVLCDLDTAPELIAFLQRTRPSDQLVQTLRALVFGPATPPISRSFFPGNPLSCSQPHRRGPPQ